MNSLFWNCNGAGKTGFGKKINYLIRRNHINTLVLFEPKISGTLAENVCKGFSLKNSFRIEARGFSGGIWLLWDDDFDLFEVISVNDNFIRINVSKQRKNFHMIFVYAPPSYNRRRRFWAELTQEVLLIQGDLILGGDLNCILDSSERQGGSGELHQDSCDFQEFVDLFGLIDLGFIGQAFTWSRGNSTATYVAKRLDRVMVNLSAQLLWPNAKVRHLPKLGSDHTPLLLILDPRSAGNRHRRPFRFEAAWLSHHDFNNFLEAVWTESSSASPALARLSPKLLAWNRECFGNIETRKAKLFDLIDEVQNRIGVVVSDDLLAENELLLKIRKRPFGNKSLESFGSSVETEILPTSMPPLLSDAVGIESRLLRLKMTDGFMTRLKWKNLP
ncbi:hypothetical protein V2J09_011175 [Rumex salicifolius]